MKPGYVKPPRIKAPKEMPVEHATRIQTYLDNAVPPLHRLVTERALTGQLARAAAVKVKCLSCCKFERDEVKHCAVVICPLHLIRPYQGKHTIEDSDDDATA